LSIVKLAPTKVEEVVMMLLEWLTRIEVLVPETLSSLTVCLNKFITAKGLLISELLIITFLGVAVVLNSFLRPYFIWLLKTS